MKIVHSIHKLYLRAPPSKLPHNARHNFNLLSLHFRYVKYAVGVQITGLILYVIPLHPVFLLVGRLISGIGDPFTSVVSGEVIRLFDEEGGARAMMIMASIYSVGFTQRSREWGAPGLMPFYQIPKKVGFFD